MQGKLGVFEEADLSLSYQVFPFSMQISVAGSNPQATTYRALMMQGVLSHLNLWQKGRFIVNDDVFQMSKEKTKHALEDELQSSPIAQAQKQVRVVLTPDQSGISEVLQALEKVSISDLISFGKEILQDFKLDGFLSGQITPADARLVWADITTALAQQPRKGDIQTVHRAWLELNGWFYDEIVGKSIAGNAIVFLVDPGQLNCRQRHALQIAMSVIKPDFYNQLRTQQQTGYEVDAVEMFPLPLYRVLAFRIQSTKFAPSALMEKIDRYLNGIRSDIESEKPKLLSQELFASAKASMLAAFKRPNMDVKELSAELVSAFHDLDGHFDAYEKSQYMLESITYSDVLMVLKQALGQQASRFSMYYTPAEPKAHNRPGIREDIVLKEVDSIPVSQKYRRLDEPEQQRYRRKGQYSCTTSKEGKR